MAEGIDGAGLGRAAARAGTALGAAYSAGRSGGLLPRAEFMLGFGGISVLVAVAATGAGVGGVAAGRAGGGGDFGGKVVAVAAVDAVFPDAEVEVVGVEAVIIIANVIDKEINTVQIVGRRIFQNPNAIDEFIITVHRGFTQYNGLTICIDNRQIYHIIPLGINHIF